MADMSGTSVSSLHSCVPRETSTVISVPVETITKPSVKAVAPGPQTRNPQTSVRLTQMKWNGTVSHRSQRTIASRFATANATQPSSTALRLSQSVAGMANGFDRRPGPEFLAQPADADVDDIRAWIEVITPDLGEQPLAADDLP